MQSPEALRMEDYYTRVGEFYDLNCSNYERHYWANGTLQRIRQSFREEVKKHSFHDVLEIGIGPGIDLAHFSSIYPEARYYGVDVSDQMLEFAQDKIQSLGLKNVTVKKGSVEDVKVLFSGQRFDLIYVFFGALNTANDLGKSLAILAEVLNPGGKMVLTFVNKWYLAEIGIRLLKLDVQGAFARQKKTWFGYSKDRTIDSVCYAPSQIIKSLNGELELVRRKGYSIVFPAWYRHHWVKRLGYRISEWLWRVDNFLNRTFAWKYGEYTLFVIRKNTNG